MLARCEGVRCVPHRLLHRKAVGLMDRVRVCTSSLNIQMDAVQNGAFNALRRAGGDECAPKRGRANDRSLCCHLTRPILVTHPLFSSTLARSALLGHTISGSACMSLCLLPTRAAARLRAEGSASSFPISPSSGVFHPKLSPAAC
jgi:hypothetical protein